MGNREDSSCPSYDDLSLAFDQRASSAVADHAERCPSCSVHWRRFADLRAAAQALPWSEPDGARGDQLEAKLIEAALFEQQLRRRRAGRGRMAGGLAVAAMVAWAFVQALRPSPAPAPPGLLAGAAPAREALGPRAQVSAPNGASFLHEVSEDGEVVRLSAGTVVVEVEKLSPAQALRIYAPDAEISATAGTFSVKVEHGRLASVQVLSGRAEVMPKSGSVVSVGAGSRWDGAPLEEVAAVPSPLKPVAARPAASSPAAPAMPGPATPRPSAAPSERPVLNPSPTPEPPPAAAIALAPVPETPTPAALPEPRSVAERAFAVGVELLASGQAALAAERFAEAMGRAEGGERVAEDAAYWRGVALGRAGRSAEAILALQAFLSEHASSSRAGLAAAMLGWLLEASGDLAGAEAQFKAALKDPLPRVQDSATRGLAAIARARGEQR